MSGRERRAGGVRDGVGEVRPGAADGELESPQGPQPISAWVTVQAASTRAPISQSQTAARPSRTRMVMVPPMSLSIWTAAVQAVC